MTSEQGNTDQGEQQPVVLYEKGEGFVRITINRPDVLNAINGATTQALLEAFSAAEEDDDVRAVILTGAGRAFSAGGDITESSARILAETSGSPRDSQGGGPGVVHMKIWEMSKPVIAAVHGFALGQACELAAVCDFTVASEEARFGEIQIRHGYGPPVLIAPYVVSLKRAKEILLLGDFIEAQEALAMGLVNRVVPSGKLMEEAESIAKRIAGLPRATVKLNKALANRAYELSGFRAAINYREEPEFSDLWAQASQDQETQERLRVLQERGWEAFRDERDAKYHGRTVEEEQRERESRS
jgi:enoyl-CoA hydratase/carnithine racemase